MKKILAAVLAGAMALSMASMAFGATYKNTISVNPPASTSGNVKNLFTVKDTLTEKGNRLEINVEEHYLYTKDSDNMVVEARVEKDKRLRADVVDGKVSVSVKRINAATNTYQVTVKPKFGIRDFDLKSWKVELDVGEGGVYYLKGKGAYSDMQEVVSGDRRVVRDSPLGADDGETGAIFNFDEVIDEEARIRCNDYVDVFFKGNYGTDKENMYVSTDEITEVSKFFGDIDLDFYDFIGTPKFATKVKVVIDADPNSVLYSYNKKTGDLTRVDADYESDGWAFTTKTLGTYVLAEEEYDAGNTKTEE